MCRFGNLLSQSTKSTLLGNKGALINYSVLSVVVPTRSKVTPVKSLLYQHSIPFLLIEAAALRAVAPSGNGLTM